MITIYYLSLFIASFLLTAVYVSQWQKRFDANMTAIFILIPVVNLAFFLMYRAQNQEAMVFGLKIVYLGGCFLPWLTTMCILDLCGIRISRLLRTGTFILTAVMYGCVLTIGYFPVFYKGIEMKQAGEVWILEREYAPMHTVFYCCVALYLVANVATIIYSLKNRKQVSRHVLYLLFLPVLTAMVGYFFNHFLDGTGYEILPVTYVLALIVYLRIAHRMTLYNVSDMAIETMVQAGDTGFILLDFKQHYLGSNETAKRLLPGLGGVTIDHSMRQEATLQQTVLKWVDRFAAGEAREKELYVFHDLTHEKEEEIYAVRVDYLYDGRRRRGYQVFLENDTLDQQNLRKQAEDNQWLESEVKRKTRRIVEMHDRLVLGMATMVESRDNSTGGHIRRTRDVVRMLIEEIQKASILDLEKDFCEKLIKAAPMHDLGKIAVDDEVLRKPGRFTPEEYDKMKRHAAEGARIVHEILRDTDDEVFRRIAENMAHYHHERVDGSGYPDGLRGEAIPLEARIMAVADVYDALVSKRVYKEKFSFDKAHQIMMDGMGTQFDERLKEAYLAARPRLEAYYSTSV